LIGAIYLDKGYDFTKEFLSQRIIKPHIDIHTLEITETNFKSKLIEWCQRHAKDISFELIPNEEGENSKLFTIQVLIDGEARSSGIDYSKKNAEKFAAEKTCDLLGI
jgi:ribonuclease-3